LHVTVEPSRSRLRRALPFATAILVVAVVAISAWLAVRPRGRASTLAAPGGETSRLVGTVSATSTPIGTPGALGARGGVDVLPSGATPSPSTTVPPTTAAPTTEPPTTEPVTTEPPTTEPPTTTTAPKEDHSAIAALQTRLGELGYSVGAADGRVGGRTSSAILAFEKVEGLERDGVPGPQVYGHLDSPEGEVPSADTGAVPRVEIDLQRQVLFVVTGAGTRTFNTSTGNDEPFEWPDGTPATAYTPTGHFSVLRRVDGIDDGPLGSLYRPLYFYDGWAIHGSSYVPAYPASHGCARVSNTDQNWIWDNVPNGTPVIVY
jgi:peptidoglycan hydrolase-like protein with peptidoglycan-binding domain